MLHLIKCLRFENKVGRWRVMKPFLIFDFDGTLVQSKSLAIQTFNQLAGKYGGRSIDEGEISELSDMSIPDRLKALHVPFYKLPGLLIEGKRAYKNAIVELQPLPGIREMLIELKEQGYTMGILSSNTKSNIERFLLLHQLDCFDWIHSATNIFGKHKAIETMSTKLGLDKNHLLYIGDELRDIEACKKVNVRVIAVTWGFDSSVLLESSSPNYICHTPEELEKLIQLVG